MLEGAAPGWRSTGESYGKVGVSARLLDGFEMREGRYLLGGAELEVRISTMRIRDLGI